MDQKRKPSIDPSRDDLAAQTAAVQTQDVTPFQRRCRSRNPSPDHLPRVRTSSPRRRIARAAGRRNCPSWARISARQLEVIPHLWKVIQSSRYGRSYALLECENFTQPPAPFHVTPRGFVEPNLLAVILLRKFGQQPLKSGRYAWRELISASDPGLADQSAPARRRPTVPSWRRPQRSRATSWTYYLVQNIAYTLCTKKRTD